MKIRDTYSILVYCTARRTVLEEEILPFEGTCSPEELAIAQRLEEINGVINYIVENCK
jgi:hypothetical protein